MAIVSLFCLLLVYNSYCQFMINVVLHIHYLLMYVNLYACLKKINMSKLYDNVFVRLSGDNIDFVHETKF